MHKNATETYIMVVVAICQQIQNNHKANLEPWGQIIHGGSAVYAGKGIHWPSQICV